MVGRARRRRRPAPTALASLGPDHQLSRSGRRIVGRPARTSYDPGSGRRTPDGPLPRSELESSRKPVPCADDTRVSRAQRTGLRQVAAGGSGGGAAFEEGRQHDRRPGLDVGRGADPRQQVLERRPGRATRTLRTYDSSPATEWQASISRERRQPVRGVVGRGGVERRDRHEGGQRQPERVRVDDRARTRG